VLPIATRKNQNCIGSSRDHDEAFYSVFDVLLFTFVHPLLFQIPLSALFSLAFFCSVSRSPTALQSVFNFREKNNQIKLHLLDLNGQILLFTLPYLLNSLSLSLFWMRNSHINLHFSLFFESFCSHTLSLVVCSLLRV